MKVGRKEARRGSFVSAVWQIRREREGKKEEYQREREREYQMDHTGRAHTDAPWVSYLALISPRNATHYSGTDTLPLRLEFPSSVACAGLT